MKKEPAPIRGVALLIIMRWKARRSIRLGRDRKVMKSIREEEITMRWEAIKSIFIFFSNSLVFEFF